MNRPAESEYAPYYHTYVGKVPEGNIIDILKRQIEETMRLLAGIPAAKADYRYAPGKWSIKEVIGHLSDSERVFTYRALRFSRNDKTPLPSFEQVDFVKYANFERRALQDLAEEFRLVRAASIALFQSFDEEMHLRTGIASGYEFTVRALPFIVAGHELHHLGILRKRYLGQ